MRVCLSDSTQAALRNPQYVGKIPQHLDRNERMHGRGQGCQIFNGKTRIIKEESASRPAPLSSRI